jgi:hypothetical protein
MELLMRQIQIQKGKQTLGSGSRVLPDSNGKVYNVAAIRTANRAAANAAWVRDRIAERGLTDAIELMARDILLQIGIES